MNQCENCHVNLSGDLPLCPLCHAQMVTTGAVPVYPRPEWQPRGGSVRLHRRIFCFCMVMSALICLLINALTGQYPWSLIVASCTATVTAAYIIITSRRFNIVKKLSIPAFAAIFLTLALDLITGYRGWSLDIVAPLLIVVHIIALCVTMFVKRVSWRDYLIFLMILIALGLLPLVLLFTGVVGIRWPSVVSAFLSVATFTGMLVFGDRKVSEELKKKFYI